jgi:hypothetical protein
MPENTKGKSPFYPGQPVPVEFFVGRHQEIDRILTRGAGQVAQGKPVAVFTQGEYGIGKSSIAGFAQWVAEKQYNLHGIYAPLSGCKDLNDLAAIVLRATVRSGALHPKRSEQIRNWLANYVGDQALFGFSLNLDALKKDAPNLSTPFQMLEFLHEVRDRLIDTGVKGVFLIFDEINGMTSDVQFANFIKGLVDSNAMSQEPLPLLLMLCGVEERRREMIERHQPVDRIFDVVEIGALSQLEVTEFFDRAFQSVQMTVEDEAMHILTHYSAGFPKIMHLLGDVAFWRDKDGIIDEKDALDAVLLAAEDVGRKYVDQQVYKALGSKDYHSILEKIGRISPSTMSFRRADILSGLTDTEKGKFDNFVQRMKKLKVIRGGDIQGEYVFNVRMVYLYIWLRSRPKVNSRK